MVLKLNKTNTNFFKYRGMKHTMTLNFPLIQLLTVLVFFSAWSSLP